MFPHLKCLCCIWFIVLYLILPNICYKCIHDEVNLEDVPSSQMTYREMRSKRDKDHEVFQPLIIHPYFDDIDPKMPDRIVSKIKYSLARVLSFIKDTIKVGQSFSPFLLERQNCAQRWESGINKNKCSRVKEGPELCSVKSTDFVIPDEFLYKLELFDYAKLQPIRIIQSGHGAKAGANFILFIISQTTSLCNEDNVQAYGSYCRLDNQSRPIAGLLNMCPTYFAKKMFQDSHYYNVIMHEIIHILGFSHHLYPKFKTCKSMYDCESPKQIVKDDLNGVQRLVFPELVKSTQRHANCTDEDFGAPLAEASGDQKYASHWHPVLMYTSIMAPSIAENDYVLVDNMTLALLASTGWYQINFANSANLKIGKDEGCNFGFKDKCESSKNLCDPKSNSPNCDILFQTVGECKSLVPYHPCGVYLPNKKEKCFEESFLAPTSSANDQSHCVMVMSKDFPEGIPECVTTRCTSHTQIEILLNSTSAYCEASEEVEMDNVTVSCPPDLSFCKKEPLPVVEDQFCLHNSDSSVSVRMHFSDPKFNDLLKFNGFKNFQVSTLKAIARHMAIPVNYIYNATLYSFKEMYLDFNICPPRNMSNEELGQLINKTQQFLKSPTFVHIFKGATELPVAATEFSTDPDYAVSFSDSDGLRMLYIIPGVCGIFIVVTFIASVARYSYKQRPKPRGEVVETEELSRILSEHAKTQTSQSLEDYV